MGQEVRIQRDRATGGEERIGGRLDDPIPTLLLSYAELNHAACESSKNQSAEPLQGLSLCQ